MDCAVLTAAGLLFNVCISEAQNVTVIGPVTPGNSPVFNSTTVIKDSGGTAANLNGNNQWTGDNCFKTGRPMADVRCWGAVGDGSTDDTTAFQNAINFVQATYAIGAQVFVPPTSAVYCLKGGITIGGSRLSGVVGGSNGPSISACGTDVVVVTMNAGYGMLENLTVVGKGLSGEASFGATQPAVSMTSGCGSCKIERAYIIGGSRPLSVASGDSIIEDVFVGSAYGSAQLYITGSPWLRRVKSDSQQPFAITPPVAAIGNWAAATGYTAGTIVKDAGYYIQATVGGTSGGSLPALKNYGVNITDNTVTWRLLGQVGQALIQVDTGALEVRGEQVDLSGAQDYGLAITNTLAGAAPGVVRFTQSVMGNNITNGVFAHDGGSVILTQMDIGSCLLANCTTILTTNNFVGPLIISNNNFLTGGTADYSIDAAALSSNIIIIGNTIATGQQVGAALQLVQNAVVMGNTCESSVNNCIQAANAASDHLTIVGNVCNGISGTCVLNSSTGTHNQIYGNDGSVVPGASGGTGVNNGTKTITLGASLTTTGAGAPTLAFTGSPFTYTFQGSSDTILGRATTDTLTNKTFDTAGTGNVFKVNGTQISSVTGSGSAVVLGTNPVITTSATINGANGHLAIQDNGTSFAYEDIVGGGKTGLRFGQEGSGAGGNLIVGSAAGDAVINNRDNTKIVIGANNTAAVYVQASGGLGVGTTGDPGAGVTNVLTGYRIGNAAASGNVLRGNGTNFVSAALAPSDLSPGAVARVKVQKFTASGTYTPSTGLLYAMVECVGSGGAGGGVAGDSSVGHTYAGGGGGAGSYSRVYLSAATIGGSQTITINAAGTGSADANGGNGGTVSMGTLCIANGGSGGLKSDSGTLNNQGGAGGTAGTGDVASAGMPGQSGMFESLASSVTVGSGMGGTSFFGGGAVGVGVTGGSAVAGVVAGNYGGGGSGAIVNGNTAGTAAGGNGSTGIVVVTEYANQ